MPVNINVCFIHLLCLKSPFGEGKRTPEWQRNNKIYLRELDIVQAQDACYFLFAGIFVAMISDCLTPLRRSE